MKVINKRTCTVYEYIGKSGDYRQVKATDGSVRDVGDVYFANNYIEYTEDTMKMLLENRKRRIGNTKDSSCLE